MENTPKTTALLHFIKTEEENYKFNDYLENHIDIEKLNTITTTEELRELIDQANENYELTDVEILYYSSAMEYLTQNDTSLRESLKLASDYGLELKNLNSETLASLLASENAREDYYGVFMDSICEFFENYDQ